MLRQTLRPTAKSAAPPRGLLLMKRLALGSLQYNLLGRPMIRAFLMKSGKLSNNT